MSIYKGMVVYYYEHGDTAYQNARPAIMLDHSPCELVATLKVLRFGTDMLLQHVKRFDHPSFEQFPHHKTEKGCWSEIPVPNDYAEPSPQSNGKQKESKLPPIPSSVLANVRKLADSGMSVPAIVGRLKDTGITIDQVQYALKSK